MLRFCKEVAGQSTKGIAGESPSHNSSVHLPPSGIDYSQPLTPTEKVDSPFQPLRPAEGSPWEHIPSTSVALSNTRSVTDESTSKRREAEKFEFEPWPQASQFNSWKVFFSRKVTTGSTHLRLSNDWLAEVDLASAVGEFDFSGFIFDTQIGKWIMKSIPTEFMRQINFLEKAQYKNKRCLRAGKSCFQHSRSSTYDSGAHDELE